MDQPNVLIPKLVAIVANAIAEQAGTSDVANSTMVRIKQNLMQELL